MLIFVLLFSVGALAAADEIPSHLNPYVEPIRSEEVQKWRPEATSTEVDQPETEVPGVGRFNYGAFHLGYLFGHSRPKHQMSFEGEFGFRSYGGHFVGWDFGPRIAIHAFGGQTAVYFAGMAHVLTHWGLWNFFLGAGYRGDKFRPTFGIGWRLWKPSSEPQSQWTFSPQFEMDFGNGKAAWALGILVGQDWQW